MKCFKICCEWFYLVFSPFLFMYPFLNILVHNMNKRQYPVVTDVVSFYIYNIRNDNKNTCYTELCYMVLYLILYFILYPYLWNKL